MTAWIAALLWLQAAPAQEPAVGPPTETGPSRIQNKGAPMRLPVTCTDDDIIALGLSCTFDDPCPIYLELGAVESVGSRIFAAGNLHTGTITLGAVLLTSDDGGQTWYEPHERIRAAGLEQIQFFDFETGWISGQVLGAIPRDPFFLLTTDGGKIWRRRPVFSESRLGVVEQFWFDSRTQGSLVIGGAQASEAGARHELYESMTGGENWMLRQVSSQPITLKRTAAPDTGWRLRADARTRSYRIERQRDAKWELVASFLVQPGECRPPEGRLAEPPEEPPPTEAPGTFVHGPSKPGTQKKPTLRKKP